MKAKRTGVLPSNRQNWPVPVQSSEFDSPSPLGSLEHSHWKPELFTLSVNGPYFNVLLLTWPAKMHTHQGTEVVVKHILVLTWAAYRLEPYGQSSWVVTVVLYTPEPGTPEVVVYGQLLYKFDFNQKVNLRSEDYRSPNQEFDWFRTEDKLMEV